MTRARRAARGAGATGSATALAAALTAGGCYEGFDPLDPEVLAEVARSRGDAQGYERSGVYQGEVEVLECGCAGVTDGAELDISLCVTIEYLESLGLAQRLELELVQADGTARVRAVGLDEFSATESSLIPVFFGPLRADGHLSAAGVLQADAVAAQGQVLGRIDGSVVREDGQWVLVGEYQQRYAVDLLGEPDVLDLGAEGETQSIDCRERIALDMHWTGPPYEPLGGS